MKKLTTPYYLIDENKLQNNLKIIQQVREASEREIRSGAEMFFNLGRVRSHAEIPGWNHEQFAV